MKKEYTKELRFDINYCQLCFKDGGTFLGIQQIPHHSQLKMNKEQIKKLEKTNLPMSFEFNTFFNCVDCGDYFVKNRAMGDGPHYISALDKVNEANR